MRNSTQTLQFLLISHGLCSSVLRTANFLSSTSFIVSVSNAYIFPNKYAVRHKLAQQAFCRIVFHNSRKSCVTLTMINTLWLSLIDQFSLQPHTSIICQDFWELVIAEVFILLNKCILFIYLNVFTMRAFCI